MSSKLIQTRYMTPRVLSYKSRDFQLLSSLLDLVANSSKLDIDYFTNQVDINKVKSSQLKNIASLVGYSYSDELTPEQNRILISNYRALNQLRGSLRGFELAVLVYGQVKGIDVRYVTPRLIENGAAVLISIEDFDYADIPIMTKIMEIVRPVGTKYIVMNSNISDPTSTTGYFTENQVYHQVRQNADSIVVSGQSTEKSIARTNASPYNEGTTTFISSDKHPDVIEDEMNIVGHIMLTDDEGNTYEDD